MKSTTVMGLAATAVLALALSACSSGTNKSGIVSLSNSSAAPQASKATGTPEQQALAFAQCMRDHGIKFPDPTVDASGNPSFAGAFGSGQNGAFDPRSADFRTAMTACRPLMTNVAFGGGRFGGNFNPQAMQDALLTYTQCLRGQGLNVGDITFGNRGGGGGSTAQPTVRPTVRPSDGPAAGVRGPGGDPSTRFAQQLGQDPTDPAWIAANKVCLPALTAAFTAARSGTATGSSTTGPQLGTTTGKNG